MTIEEFYTDLRQNLLARSGADGNFTRSTFVNHMCTLLEEQGTISSHNQTDYKFTSKGHAVDAWAMEEEFSTLYLLVADHRDAAQAESLLSSEIAAAFARLTRFFDAAQSVEFAESLDESMPVTELAWLIAKRTVRIEKLVLVLLSNALISSRVTDLPTAKVGGLPTVYEVWDLGRLHRLESSGREREEIEVDFTAADPRGIGCLPAFASGGSVQSYLMVIPGPVLASLYLQHGERLFEQNVRTFLQFRGKVNKGIRSTIIHEPHMFFSYNNGISATAEEVITSENDSRILRVRNLQIVNGGQTTASIFTAQHREGADLSRVHVQVKLSVVPTAQVETVVPRISEYANTQNKVSAADFFSNHPFHLRIEEFSRRLWAPSPEGRVQESHWFYERARGQYANMQASLTAGERKTFLLQNPSDQMFTKTDLAKFILTFDESPHAVSLGAQKAFAGTTRTPGFVSMIAKEWDSSGGNTFNEIWFKRAIAKAILFRELDRLILDQEWYSGYKANIVTYTLAKFAQMVRNAERTIDFLKIWQSQALPETLAEELPVIAKIVNQLLLDPPPGTTSNVSEWAKQPACWAAVSETKIGLPARLRPYLSDFRTEVAVEREAGKKQAVLSGIEAQTYVVTRGARHWAALRNWNEINRKLSPKEMGILDVACAMPRKLPTEQQVLVLIAAEKRAIGEGFRHQ
jgi:hypothetical protein